MHPAVTSMRFLVGRSARTIRRRSQSQSCGGLKFRSPFHYYAHAVDTGHSAECSGCVALADLHLAGGMTCTGVARSVGWAATAVFDRRTSSFVSADADALANLAARPGHVWR